MPCHNFDHCHPWLRTTTTLPSSSPSCSSKVAITLCPCERLCLFCSNHEKLWGAQELARHVRLKHQRELAAASVSVVRVKGDEDEASASSRVAIRDSDSKYVWDARRGRFVRRDGEHEGESGNEEEDICDSAFGESDDDGEDKEDDDEGSDASFTTAPEESWDGSGPALYDELKS